MAGSRSSSSREYVSPRAAVTGSSSARSAGSVSHPSAAAVSQRLHLSESDDDDNVPSSNSHHHSQESSVAASVGGSSTGGNQKGLALRAMFGLKAGKGAKAGGKGGKGKSGAGKGGINVIVKEDHGGSDDDDDDADSDREVGSGRLGARKSATPVQQSPQQQSRKSDSVVVLPSPPLSSRRHPATMEPPKVAATTPSSWAVPTPPQTAALAVEKTSTALSPSPSRSRRSVGVVPNPPLESGQRTPSDSADSGSRRRRHDKWKLDNRTSDPTPARPPSRSLPDSDRSKAVGAAVVKPVTPSPPPSPSLPPLVYRPDGRPSLVCSLPLSRVSRAGSGLSSRGSLNRGTTASKTSGGRDKKNNGGKELWLTKSSSTAKTTGISSTISESPYQHSSDRTSGGGESVSDRLLSPLPVTDRPLSRSAAGWSASSRERRESGGCSARSSSAAGGYKSSAASHRKQVERTLSPLEADDSVVTGGGESFLFESVALAGSVVDYESEGGSYDRKRRGRDRSPSDSGGVTKRLRPEDEEEEEEEVGGSRRRRRGGELLLSTSPPTAAAHPTFLPNIAAADLGGGGVILMPPPASTVPVYFSYFER